MERQTTEIYKDLLSEVIRLYNRGGFTVKYINADNEFRPLVEPLADEFEVEFNFTNPQDHEPTAERTNRTMKERI